MRRRSSPLIRLLPRVALLAVAVLPTAAIASSIAIDPAAPSARPLGKHDRKDATGGRISPPLLATLVDTHSPLRLELDQADPRQAPFDAMLADPVLGTVHTVDPALLGLVRSLVVAHGLARVEVVSGFRSPKLNEALRKKGHHVASHSLHSLGHAMDMRIVPDGASEPMDPRALAAEARTLGWNGGIGIYLSPNDRFMHADVGARRTWYGQ